MEKRANHLINEKSPYLLQHAYNPVDWYPWGKAAFKKAREEDKPILVSIGYSTCHWCHVMEPVQGILNSQRLDGRSTAYICVNKICQLPTNDPLIVRSQLNQ